MSPSPDTPSRPRKRFRRNSDLPPVEPPFKPLSYNETPSLAGDKGAALDERLVKLFEGMTDEERRPLVERAIELLQDMLRSISASCASQYGYHSTAIGLF